MSDIRVESSENVHHLLVVLLLVLVLGQSSDIQSLSLRLIGHLVGASEASSGPLLPRLALELLAIVARGRPPVARALEGRPAVSIALLPRLAWTDLDLAATETGPEISQSSLSGGPLGKVHEAVARVASADGVDRDVDVLNVVEAILEKKLFNVLRLEDVVEIACDRSVLEREAERTGCRAQVDAPALSQGVVPPVSCSVHDDCF